MAEPIQSSKLHIASYPNIPDHSDLRGFSYRAPVNYEWSDDHEVGKMADPLADLPETREKGTEERKPKKSWDQSSR